MNEQEQNAYHIGYRHYEYSGKELKWEPWYVRMEVGIRRFICKHFDHNWENADWSGPESGGIARECKRCGHYMEYILY